MGNVIGAKMILRTYHEPNPVAEMGAWLWSVTRLHVQIMRTKEQAKARHAEQKEGRSHMKSLTSHMQRAPTSSPCRVQMLWGMICARGQELWHSFEVVVSLNLPVPWQLQLSLGCV